MRQSQSNGDVCVGRTCTSRITKLQTGHRTKSMGYSIVEELCMKLLGPAIAKKLKSNGLVWVGEGALMRKRRNEEGPTTETKTSIAKTRARAFFTCKCTPVWLRPPHTFTQPLRERDCRWHSSRGTKVSHARWVSTTGPTAPVADSFGWNTLKFFEQAPPFHDESFCRAV